MRNPATLLPFLLWGCCGGGNAAAGISSEVRTLAAGESPRLVGKDGKGVSKVAEEAGKEARSGSYGDLIYRYRENGDSLILREVVVLPEISSEERDVQWYATTPARRISTVRVLNFGLDRVETYRIDVAGGDAQAIFRVPSLYDPRIMIEVYGT